MNRGEVVEVDWPFTDLTGTKPRPAVVVQADFLNGLVDDTIYIEDERSVRGEHIMPLRPAIRGGEAGRSCHQQHSNGRSHRMVLPRQTG
jgi:hypothetical protein